MSHTIKESLRTIVERVVHCINRNRAGRYLFNQILQSGMGRSVIVHHNGVELRFVTPNPLCEWRAKTFSSKEPETLEWIDSMPEQSIVWDIGANVGLYSVYAAKKRNCRVFSFEPSVFNLELLARNIYLNGLTERISIVPLPLSDQLGVSQMRMTTTEWGGALSTFDREFGWDGQQIRQVFQFPTIGLTMNDAVERLGIPLPDYIKMDVDGLEHFILKGGVTILSRVRGILIEVNDDFSEQAATCGQLLHEAGLVMTDKRHSELIGSSTTGFQHCYDQIWARP